MDDGSVTVKTLVVLHSVNIRRNDGESIRPRAVGETKAGAGKGEIPIGLRQQAVDAYAQGGRGQRPVKGEGAAATDVADLIQAVRGERLASAAVGAKMQVVRRVADAA